MSLLTSLLCTSSGNGGGGSGWENAGPLITADNVANIDIPLDISKYSSFVINFTIIRGSVSNQELRAIISPDSGASFFNSASDIQNRNLVGGQFEPVTNALKLSQNVPDNSADPLRFHSGVLQIENAHVNDCNFYGFSYRAGLTPSGGRIAGEASHRLDTSQSTINLIRFFMASGNIYGRFQLRGFLK